MTKSLFKDIVLWGIGLWFIGYVLGIVLFFVLPSNILGWVIMPIGIVLTLWVLATRIKSTSFFYYLSLGISWTVLAIVLDYFLLVQLFKPADGYYKLDVYLYYIFTFTLPLLVGLVRKKA